jgi:hypothetical protein
MIMKRGMQAFWWVALAALSLTPLAVAQTSITLTGPPPGYVYDGIYMSPYYATVGGATNTPVVCDDFGDDSTSGATWNATITPFSGISSTNTSWGLAGGSMKQYDAAAALTLDVLHQTPGTTGQIIYSFAEWAVFDPTGVASYLTSNPVTGAGLTTAALCTDIFGIAGCKSPWVLADGGLLASGYNASVPTGGYSNLEIISPDNANGKICKAETGCAAQEFIAVVPEGGAALAYLFLAVLCCGGAIFMRSRQQMGTMESA